MKIAINVSHNHWFSQLGVSDDPPSELPVFQWVPLHNITSLNECRNSQQGHTLIADELGSCQTHTGTIMPLYQ